MINKIIQFPSKNLTTAIPITLLVGFLLGYQVDTSFLKSTIMTFTFFMIYPTMIGFKLKEAIDLSHMKPLLISMILNFIVIPFFALLIAQLFWKNDPDFFIGLIMISLFPTSGMTISWTMLNKGNVPAAIKITAISLIAGSIVAPIYLYVMVGAMVPINMLSTAISIIQVVILPLLLGNATYRILMKYFSEEQYTKKIKPYFSSISVWFMLLIVFVSISMKSRSIVGNPTVLVQIGLILAVFYIFNFFLSTVIARRFLTLENGYALLYGTVMRNLSIALGIAATAFGPNTALVVTVAYIIQVQSAAWYGKLSAKHRWLERKKIVASQNQ